jgi:hypothetical protein
VQQLGGKPDAFVDLHLVKLVHLQPKRYIVVHSHMREDGITLEHHGDLALARRQVGHITSANADASIVCHA